MIDKLIDLVVTFIKLFFFGFYLNQYERGVLLRFGKFVKEVGPGFHFKIPMDIDMCVYNTTFPCVRIMGPQSLTTKDGKSVVVSYLVTYQIEDMTKCILESQGPAAILEYASFGVVSDFVKSHSWDELRNVNAVDQVKDIDIDNEVAKAIRRRAKKYGVQVRDVGFIDLTLTRSIRVLGMGPAAIEHIA